MQIVDEARHAEAFTRRAEAGGVGLGTTATSGQLSLQTLLEEPDFTTATFLLCVMGEGTFLTLLNFLAEHAPDPVTAALARLAHRDEARHVAFGTEHLRYVLEREPEKRLSLTAAVERRSHVLASVSGLSPYVHDALVVYAGGGVSLAQVRNGARRVAELHREMDRTRRERLRSLGFEAGSCVSDVRLSHQELYVRAGDLPLHSSAEVRLCSVQLLAQAIVQLPDDLLNDTSRVSDRPLQFENPNDDPA